MGYLQLCMCFKGSEATSPKPRAMEMLFNNKKNNQISDNSIAELYSFGKELGSGAYSIVREAVHNESGKKYAIKCIERDGLSQEDEKDIVQEISILQQLQHPNIMTLKECYETPKYYYLVTEYVVGGEVFERILEKTFYSEKDARDLVRCLLDAIQYLHKNGIIHRDLKPENLLLLSELNDTLIKIVDFGFAKKLQVDDNNGLATICGTPGYIAPEILSGHSYGKPVDIWSIGVIVYILLCGYPPFSDDSQVGLFRKISQGFYQFDSPFWDDVSDGAKEFVRRMLVVDPEKRATVEELLADPWITQKDVVSVPLSRALAELRHFNATKKFRAAFGIVKVTMSLNKNFSRLKSPKNVE